MALTKVTQTVIATGAISSSQIANGSITADHLTGVNTDHVSEGSTNVYFSNARARSSLSGSTGVTYDSSSGAISIGQAVGTSDSVAFGQVTVDNITINGSTISSASSMVLDVVGNLTVNVDGTTITLADDAINFGQFYNNASGQFNIYAPTQDKDIVFLGNDGGSTITALTLDMSSQGDAIFNNDILLGDGNPIRFGDGQDLRIWFDGNHANIQNTASDSDIYIKGNDGGSTITMLNFDTSNLGKATFSGDIITPGSIAASSDASQIQLGSGNRAQIFHNSAGLYMRTSTGPVYAQADSFRHMASDASTDYLVSTSTALTVNSGLIKGPSTLTIDPAAHGDNTGTVVIAGDLQVDGTTTTINSTTVNIDDLNIQLATGAANAAAADGAGITVDGANATLNYNGTLDTWEFNKELRLTTGSFASHVNGNRYIKYRSTYDSASVADFELKSDNNSAAVARITSTGTADVLQVFDNTTQVVTIADGGKVGIGNSNPLQKFSVGGLINSDFDQDYYGAWMNGDSGTNGYSIMAVGEWYSAGLYIQKKTGENRTHIYNYNASHPLIINAGSSTHGETTSSKSRLGIGTFSPNAVVHIQGQNPAGLIVENGTNNAPTQPFVSMAANNYSSGFGTFRWEDQRASQASPSFIWEVHDGSGTTLAYDFRTGATGASGSKLAITQSGNVGIGTTSPEEKLHVLGQGSFENSGNTNRGNIIMGAQGNGVNKWATLAGTHYNEATGSGNGSENAGIMIIGSHSTSTANQIWIGHGPYELNPATEIRFGTHTTNTHNLGGTTHMTINSAGNVTFTGTLTSGQINSSVSSGDLHNQFTSTSGNAKLSIISADAGDAWINLSGASNEMSIGYERTSSEFRICNADTLTSGVRMQIKSSSGYVGINGEPQNLLHIQGGSSDSRVQFTNNSSGNAYADGFWVGMDSSQAYLLQRENQPLIVYTNATRRFEVQADGTIGIGNSSAAYGLMEHDYTGYNSGSPEYRIIPNTTPGSGTLATTTHFKNTNGGSTSSNNRHYVKIDGQLHTQHQVLPDRTFGIVNGQQDNAHGILIYPYATYSTRYSSWNNVVGTNASAAIGSTDSGFEQTSSYGGAGAAAFEAHFNSFKWHVWPSSATTGQGASLSASTYEIASLDNVGNMSIDGSLTQNASDERLKENITVITGAINKVKALRGVEFDWKTTTPQPMRGHDIGLIAQEVQAVCAEAVKPAPFDQQEVLQEQNPDENDGIGLVARGVYESKSGEDYLTVDTNKIVPILIEAIKELEARITELEG